jgi:hypothetical protein
MRKVFMNQRGNISIAMLMAVIGVMSGLTMTSLAMRDIVAYQWDYEGLQGLHFLRSEASRGQAILQRAGEIIGTVYTPQRSVEMRGSNMSRTFTMQSKIIKDLQMAQGAAVGGNYSGVAITQGYVIKSLINAKAGVGQVAFLNSRGSIVRNYGEFFLRKQRYSEFMYFTDTDESTNGTNVYFYGPDIIHGRVHSNTDIWIKQAGGGTNQGWPTFHDLVTTSGKIRTLSGVIPYESVFLGGYLEEYNKYEFPDEATTIQANGVRVGPLNYDPKYIVYVDVDNTTYSAMLGTKSDPYIEHAFVYNNYPTPPLGTPLYRNTYSIQDTVWTSVPGGSGTNRSFYVPNELWIKGTFAGMQTWATGDTMYLVGDILLQGTQIGQSPDTPPMNQSDIVGLVSEKSILIKYGYRDPIDSSRVHPNCGPNEDTPTEDAGINIYAALCALGDGGGNPHYDGVFSFEYQHPHPSVPDFRIGNEIFTKIDLHRRRFPQNSGSPWPPNIDYPWYNPLWPERQPYMERGDINLWGSVAQRRRGFVHRSPLDSEYPTGGVWNIPIDACGGTSNVNYMDPVLNIPMNTRHYPGASGTGTGYAKNYHYDTRFYFTAPLDFPEVNLQGGYAPMEAESWVIKRPPRTL